MFGTPAFLTAFHIALASRTSLASGFSHRIALPAWAAAIAISGCESPGVQMSTRSTSGRDHLAPVGGPLVPAKLRRGLLDVPPVAAAEDLEAGREPGREEAADLPPGVAVGAAHEGVADESDIHFAHEPSGPGGR
jgi:hypothetical protein